MVPIKWSREALQNLKEIKEYISKDSAYYANRLVNEIRFSIKVLKKYPEIGKPFSSQEDMQFAGLI